MEMKSISDCLNFIDSMILCSIETYAGIENSKDLGNCMLGMYNEKYIEEMVGMLSILSHINLIIKKFYLHNESDIEKLYCDLKKRILAWLEASNIEPEIDNQQ